MPKVVVSPQKGLVQSTGSGFGIAGTNSGAGLYEFVKEIDLSKVNGGVLSATTATAIAGICSLPEQSIIMDIRFLVTGNVAAQKTDIDVIAVATGNKPTAVNQAITGGTTLLDNGDLTGDAAFAVGSYFETQAVAADQSGKSHIASNAAIAATKPHIYLAAGDNSNSTDAHTTAKLMVHIEYYAAEPAEDLNI